MDPFPKGMPLAWERSPPQRDALGIGQSTQIQRIPWEEKENNGNEYSCRSRRYEYSFLL